MSQVCFSDRGSICFFCHGKFPFFQIFQNWYSEFKKSEILQFYHVLKGSECLAWSLCNFIKYLIATQAANFSLKPPRLQSWLEIHWWFKSVGDFGALTAVARAGSSQAKAALMLCRFLESEIEVGNDAIVQFMQPIYTYILNIEGYQMVWIKWCRNI